MVADRWAPLTARVSGLPAAPHTSVGGQKASKFTLPTSSSCPAELEAQPNGYHFPVQVNITGSLTIIGGYADDTFTGPPDPNNPTILDAGGAGSVMTVSGSDESSTSSGLNGENASSDTFTGQSLSAYSTSPSG